jgi:ABC-type multidrug transport system fused ATPase/permease subunit
MLGSIEERTMEAFYKAMGFGLVFIIGTSLLFLISRFLRIRFMRDTVLDVRLAAFDKIMRMNFDQFSRKSKEVYISNLINDINVFEQNFFFRLLNIIFNSGTYFFSILILMILDFKFGLSVLGISLIVFAIAKSFEKKTISLQEDVSDLNEKFTVDVSNTVNGMEILKLNQIEGPFLDKTLKAVNQVETKKMKLGVFSQAQRGVTMVLGTAIFVGLLLYLLERVQNGMSYTQMAFMVQTASSCIWPIQQVMPLVNELKASVRIFDKITKDEELDEASPAGEKPFDFNHAVKVKNASFSYNGKNVLKDINLTIEKGKKYLVRGASGTGKSTLLKILSKTISGYKGEIDVDDVPLKEISMDAFNDKVTFIYQDVFLFEDTLYNNISLYQNINERIILAAAEKAGLKDVLDHFDQGVHHFLSENGKNLSGGQRQRVSIARAIAKNSEILFADEATSSLNYELGCAIEETLLNLECTVISVSHRYYQGITEKYDFVLELSEDGLKQVPAEIYFREAVAA